MEDAASDPAVEKRPSSDVRPPLDPPKTREEGELSSDDDDDNPICSVAHPSAIITSSSVAVPVPPMDKFTQAIQAGNSLGENNPVSSADAQSQPSVQPSSQKINDENRIPLKMATSGWRAPPRGNSNLVISFSDDDSHSDSEEKKHRKEKSRGTNSRVTGVVVNGKPSTTSFVRSSKLRQTARNVDKVGPKKVLMNRTFIPPVTKVGGLNSRAAGPSSADQVSLVRNFNSRNRNVASRERGSDSEMQDLRQQIALRESELKLKSAQRTKESVTFRVGNAVGPDTDEVSKSSVRNSDVIQTEPKEPDKKRLKVGGTFSTQLSVLGPKDISVAKSVLSSKVPAVEELSASGPKDLPVAKSVLSSKVPIVEDSSQPEAITINHGQKGIPVGLTESSIAKGKYQSDKHVSRISQNMHSVVKNGSGIDAALKFAFPISMEFNHTSKTGGRLEPGSFLKKSSSGKNLMTNADHREVISSDKKLGTSNNMCEASLNNAIHWNCVGNENVTGNGDMNIHSWDEMEEMLDKDLEEAQENRRRCEIEERNALKAYRKAQRDLLQANARCSELYRRREQYSANMRSFMMDNPSLIWSTRQNEPVGIGLNHPSNISENLNLNPTSSHQMHPEYTGTNQTACDSRIQCVNSSRIHTSDNQLNGQNVGSEPCSELDASTSELVPLLGSNAGDVVPSPSSEPNNSADEDEGRFSFENESVQHDLLSHKHTEFGENRKDIVQESNRKMSSDGCQDPVLLERMLRSKLFAILGPKNLSKNSSPHSETELAVERGAENDVRSKKAEALEGGFPFSEVGKDHQSDHEGTDGKGKSSSEAPLEIQREHSVENVSVSNSYTDDRFYSRGYQGLTPVIFSPSNILRSAATTFMKVTCPKRLIEHQDQSQRSETCINSEKVMFSSSIVDPLEEILVKLSGREVGSYTTGPAVDPFWPLCMYELRGKCNNDECPWQHIKDYSNTNRHRKQNDTSDSADCQVELTSHGKKCDGSTNLTSPTYLVGSGTLKADLRSYEVVLAHRDSQSWKKCFSLFLVLSDLFQKDLPANCQFLHRNDSCVEIPASWSRQSSFFQSRDGGVNQLTQALADNDQYLEAALLIFSQEANELEGMRKALPVLSRAVEADPKSIVLWIFYLLIYYSQMKSVEEDDMFSCAVKYNDRSYELWLMYINSRMQLDDKLVTYNAALSAFCRHAPTSDVDGLHASPCILDLSLQMLECLCMSGNVEKAIKKIFGLFPAATDFDEPNSLLPPDIFTCLTIYDKCIFGVCCVYLVVYRTFPDDVVRQFECQKELFEIEWPSIQLIDDEKQRAILLMETVVDSVNACMKTESGGKSEFNLRFSHFLALNHLRCLAALDSLERCRNLLDKYLTSYPSCLELVLISVRAHKHDLEDSVFERFEHALSKWPKGVPGIQCIWNQYVEYALQNGRLYSGKEMLDRWFNSAWKVHYLQNGTSDEMECDDSDSSLGLGSDSVQQTLSWNPKQMDEMFGYLNLSLYKFSRNDHIEGRLALDRALSASVPQYLKHCIREHAFMNTDESLIKENACISDIQKILERYLGEGRAFPTYETLSRKFLNDINKPRLRQLASNVFSSLSSGFPLVNSVLEVWYGPSLLPKNFSEQKYLVDFVEAILDITPSNYQLAFSVCKLLRSSGGNASDVTAASTLFWASSNLVSTIFLAVPIPPQYVWVEAAEIVSNTPGVEVISERYYQRALAVYPFSVKLWKSYSILSTRTTGNAETVVEAAKEKGIELS